MTLGERAFFTSMGATMLGLRTVSRSRTAVHASRTAARALDLEPRDIEEWALAELRSTSPWAVAQAIASLGRHHSRPWLGEIDVPTAVVVNRNDHVIQPARQIAVARAIPGATIHDIDTGHAACVHVVGGEVLDDADVGDAARERALAPGRDLVDLAEQRRPRCAGAPPAGPGCSARCGRRRRSGPSRRTGRAASRASSAVEATGFSIRAWMPALASCVPMSRWKTVGAATTA